MNIKHEIESTYSFQAKSTILWETELTVRIAQLSSCSLGRSSSPSSSSSSPPPSPSTPSSSHSAPRRMLSLPSSGQQSWDCTGSHRTKRSSEFLGRKKLNQFLRIKALKCDWWKVPFMCHQYVARSPNDCDFTENIHSSIYSQSRFSGCAIEVRSKLKFTDMSCPSLSIPVFASVDVGKLTNCI